MFRPQLYFTTRMQLCTNQQGAIALNVRRLGVSNPTMMKDWLLNINCVTWPIGRAGKVTKQRQRNLINIHKPNLFRSKIRHFALSSAGAAVGNCTLFWIGVELSFVSECISERNKGETATTARLIVWKGMLKSRSYFFEYVGIVFEHNCTSVS